MGTALRKFTRQPCNPLSPPHCCCSELSLLDCASFTTTPLATCQQEKRASGHEGCEPHDRGTVALAGVALGLVVARGQLPLPLREFRMDGAQTPLTGHLPPPPHRMRVPQATGSMLQIDEPSMDGVRHEGPPAPPT